MTAPDPYVQGPFDSAHMFLQWGGTLPGDEEWTCGIRLATTGSLPIPLADAVTFLPTYGTAVSAFHARASTKIASESKLTHVKLNWIGTDGRYAIQNTNELPLNPVSGGGGAGGYPNQISCAVTTETGFARGPAHSGRFFLPLPSMGVGADGMISQADALAIAVSANQFIDALKAVSAPYDPAVFSRKAGAAAHRLITGCSVGRVLDTQRRRRNKLLETRVRP